MHFLHVYSVSKLILCAVYRIRFNCLQGEFDLKRPGFYLGNKFLGGNIINSGCGRNTPYIVIVCNDQNFLGGSWRTWGGSFPPPLD